MVAKKRGPSPESQRLLQQSVKKAVKAERRLRERPPSANELEIQRLRLDAYRRDGGGVYPKLFAPGETPDKPFPKRTLAEAVWDIITPLGGRINKYAIDPDTGRYYRTRF